MVDLSSVLRPRLRLVIPSLFFLLFLTVVILFGCPFMKYYTDSCHFIRQPFTTAIWCLLVTLVAVLPLTCVLPTHWDQWNKALLLLEYSSLCERWSVYNFYLVLIGSWVGSVLLLLDWNTAWQVWPIPCCVGSLIGSVLSVLCCFLVHVSSKIQ